MWHLDKKKKKNGVVITTSVVQNGNNQQVTIGCSCERGPTFTASVNDFIIGSSQYIQALVELQNHIAGTPKEEKHELTSSNPSITLSQLYRGGTIMVTNMIGSQ